MEEINELEQKAVPGAVLTRKNIFFLLGAAIFIVLYYFFAAPPGEFPKNRIIPIKEGVSLSETAELLERENLIRSAGVLRGVIFLSGKQKYVIAGDYLFTKPENVFTIAQRLMLGEHDLSPIKVTIPEGTASFDMPGLFGQGFYNFDTEEFLKITKDKEGYLFPDTYFFYPNAKTTEIIKIMTDNFNRKIKELEGEISLSGKRLGDIIIMASIIEKEVRTPEDQRLVSGILWKRITIRMPLQVDAPFAYISDKSTHELSLGDLATTSPYNTYKYAGLPPGPIGNPGLSAIRAAINPEPSDYLYYLSDRSGKTYYAKTFDEHKRNKALYLNK